MNATVAVRLTVAVVLLSYNAGCALAGRNNLPPGRGETEHYITMVRGGLHEFEAVNGLLPTTLRQMCPTMVPRDCSWLLPGWEYEDGWGTALEYQRLGDNYEIRSAGPDRRSGTEDDIIVNRAAERRAVSEYKGCYVLSTEVPELVDLRLVLDSTETYPGWFRVGTELPRYHISRWTVNPEGEAQITWMEQHSGLQLRLRRTWDQLQGTALCRSWRGDASVIAVRTPC